MSLHVRLAALGAGSLLACLTASSLAATGSVTWADDSCGYFALALPEGNEAEAFGLYSVKAPPTPAVGDTIEGDIVTAPEPTLANTTKNVSHDVIHWANAPKLETLVRSAPVQCASKWKNRKKR